MDSAAGRLPVFTRTGKSGDENSIVKLPHIAAVGHGVHPHIAHSRDELLGDGVEEQRVEVLRHLGVQTARPSSSASMIQ